jgi:signal transduction histidine kinase
METNQPNFIELAESEPELSKQVFNNYYEQKPELARELFESVLETNPQQAERILAGCYKKQKEIEGSPVAERANFLGNLRHEVCSPLTLTLGYSQLLEMVLKNELTDEPLIEQKEVEINWFEKYAKELSTGLGLQRVVDGLDLEIEGELTAEAVLRAVVEKTDKYLDLLKEEKSAKLKQLEEEVGPDRVITPEPQLTMKDYVKKIALPIKKSRRLLRALYFIYQEEKIAFTPEEINLTDIIEEHILGVNLRLDKLVGDDGQQLEVELDDKTEGNIHTDEVLLDIVLKNIFENAVKYGDSKLKVQVRQDQEKYFFSCKTVETGFLQKSWKVFLRGVIAWKEMLRKVKTGMELVSGYVRKWLKHMGVGSGLNLKERGRVPLSFLSYLW